MGHGHEHKLIRMTSLVVIIMQCYQDQALHSWYHRATGVVQQCTEAHMGVVQDGLKQTVSETSIHMTPSFSVFSEASCSHNNNFRSTFHGKTYLHFPLTQRSTSSEQELQIRSPKKQATSIICASGMGTRQSNTKTLLHSVSCDTYQFYISLFCTDGIVNEANMSKTGVKQNDTTLMK